MYNVRMSVDFSCRYLIHSNFSPSTHTLFVPHVLRTFTSRFWTGSFDLITFFLNTPLLAKVTLGIIDLYSVADFFQK